MTANDCLPCDTRSPAPHKSPESEPEKEMKIHSLPTRTCPDIWLFGAVNSSMLAEFSRQQSAAPDDKALVFELSTSGGEADTGRRIAEELRLW